MLAVQCLDRLEYVHSRGVLHRDVKPANFVMSRTTPSIVNIIDFGLAKRYRQPLNGEHIPYSQHPDALHGVGTSLYASLNTHFGVETGRRDDLESLAYMLIGFVRGGLPWRKVRATVDPPPNWPSKEWNPITQTWNLIREEKVKAEVALLTGLPEEFGVLYRYARTLQFTDLPDYEGLRQLFRGLAEREGFLDADVPPPRFIGKAKKRMGVICVEFSCYIGQIIIAQRWSMIIKLCDIAYDRTPGSLGSVRVICCLKKKT
ncbi:kinase-like protein [Lentinula edodes]|uniref:non-specific serine/threonine protein kinase n=1 Tax=Lentinula edodes TaxID=5353 RepID=A0A1Q3E1E1_LENED|nr:kinase-like protein [Lentinula edodes]